LKGPRSGLKCRLAGLQSHFSGLQSHFAGLKCHFADLHSLFAGLKNYFADLQSLFAGLKIHFADLQRRFAGLQNHFVSLKNHFVSLQSPLFFQKIDSKSLKCPFQSPFRSVSSLFNGCFSRVCPIHGVSGRNRHLGFERPRPLRAGARHDASRCRVVRRRQAIRLHPQGRANRGLRNTPASVRGSVFMMGSPVFNGGLPAGAGL